MSNDQSLDDINYPSLQKNLNTFNIEKESKKDINFLSSLEKDDKDFLEKDPIDPSSNIYSKEILNKIYQKLYYKEGKNILLDLKIKKTKFRNFFIRFLLKFLELEIEAIKRGHILKMKVFNPASSEYINYDKNLLYKNWKINWNFVIELFFIFMRFVFQDENLTATECFNLCNTTEYLGPDIRELFKKRIGEFKSLKLVRNNLDPF